jgi:hypothetical protein
MTATPLVELAGLAAIGHNSSRYRAHAVLLLCENMLNVSHAVIGRVVAVTYAGFGLAFTYGRRIMAPVQGAIIALFPGECRRPYQLKGVWHLYDRRCSIHNRKPEKAPGAFLEQNKTADQGACRFAVYFPFLLGRGNMQVQAKPEPAAGCGVRRLHERLGCYSGKGDNRIHARGYRARGSTGVSVSP